MSNSKELTDFIFTICENDNANNSNFLKKLIKTFPEEILSLYSQLQVYHTLTAKNRTYYVLDSCGEKIGSKISNNSLDVVRGYMKAGEKIEAIKALRTVSGVGLKEAKDAVENDWFKSSDDFNYEFNI